MLQLEKLKTLHKMLVDKLDDSIELRAQSVHPLRAQRARPGSALHLWFELKTRLLTSLAKEAADNAAEPKPSPQEMSD